MIDPHVLLQVPACVITENDTHVVVAIRIEKSALKQQVPFLGALLNLTVDDNAVKPWRAFLGALLNLAIDDSAVKPWHGRGQSATPGH